ncbi:selenocysteinyl-tRNA-specific translation factor [Escherichia coli]|uniref:Selenocysteinyl-tRNA-specific translation factor n=1 Tax=Escherichia coli TaxID=562 RepID=A0A377BWE5_ECOLX|nr:selenocysteinyl-tRNA-specific translation factor [Escherichia coli]
MATGCLPMRRQSRSQGDCRASNPYAADPVAAAAYSPRRSHVTGRVSLLEDNLADWWFDTPLWLADNDRLVLRDISGPQHGWRGACGDA